MLFFTITWSRRCAAVEAEFRAWSDGAVSPAAAAEASAPDLAVCRA